MTTPAAQITLRALQGEPLADAAVRATVVATAHAIAERTGVDLLAIEPDVDRVTVVLGADRIAAIGFAAELRRLTNAWYSKKYHSDSLWGVSPDLPHDGEVEDDGESWR